MRQYESARGPSSLAAEGFPELGRAVAPIQAPSPETPADVVLMTVPRFLGDRSLIAFDPRGRLAWLSEAARARLGERFRPSVMLQREVCRAAAVPNVRNHVARGLVDGSRLTLNVLRQRDQTLVLGELLAAADALSPAETRVFEALGRGLSNADIGALLHVSVATVKTHVHRILEKVGARSRLELATRARERGGV